MTATVHIVHCIDTEGPLYEGPDEQFRRLKVHFNIDGIPATRNNLDRLRRAEIDLDGKEQGIAEYLNDHHLDYMSTWNDLDAMLDRITSPAYRKDMVDSDGGGWVYNWFCMDHINYSYNPRRRDIGYHNIFDRYRELTAEQPDSGDTVHWHFHPMSTFNDAHFCATHYFRSPEIFEILSRKVIERQWFPAAYRAGFQTERPDSHWFLEQWIPFDISNMSTENKDEIETQQDFRMGRSGDWRRAPTDWSPYHPDHDDYQKPGQCRRWIGRGLNVLNRVANIDQHEMDKAFALAAEGKPAVVGVVGHDWRDLEPEIDHLRTLIATSRKRYPDVRFKFQGVDDAFRDAIWPDGIDGETLDLELELLENPKDDMPHLIVRTKAGKVFGPQPYLAIETRGRQFVHDNFDFSMSGDEWSYAFHFNTLELENVARIGVAANDRFGNTCVKQLDLTKPR